MADNTTLNPGSGGDTIRDIDKAGKKTQVVTLDVGGAGAETLVAGTVPVSGTVTATGPLTDTQLRLTPVPVSGTVAITPPVPVTDNAGSLTIDSTQLPAALGAGGGIKVDGSGTALPISGTVTANAGSGPFPVSDNAGSLTVDAPVGTPVAARLSDGAAFYDATKTGQLPSALVGARLDVNNGAWLGSTAPTVGSKTSANSVPVVVASDQAVIPVSDNAGSLTVDAPVGTPVFARLSDGSAALVGQKAMASSLPVAIASDQTALPAPTLTKGTQGSTGYSVQDLKDSGRVNIMWTAEFAFAQTAETLLTLTESRDGAATTTFSSKVVTNGKRLRITSMLLEAETLGTGTTVPQRCYLRMRFNTAGAATTSSPIQFVGGVAALPATIKNAAWESWAFPDGIEFLGDGTKQIGFSLETPDWVVTTQTGRAKVTITAFEY